MTSSARAIAQLLAQMADVFSNEERPEADLTADVLNAASALTSAPTVPPYALDSQIREALVESDHPLAVTALAAQERIPWEASGPLDAKIPTSVSQVYSSACFVGPGALIDRSDMRAGLFVQTANSYYQLHSHEAAETYVVVAGTPEWTVDDMTERKRPGDYIHHVPFAAHAFRTHGAPLFAIWRWSGNIGIESYQLLDDPNL